jgi:hypothetical protein
VSLLPSFSISHSLSASVSHILITKRAHTAQLRTHSQPFYCSFAAQVAKVSTYCSGFLFKIYPRQVKPGDLIILEILRGTQLLTIETVSHCLINTLKKIIIFVIIYYYYYFVSRMIHISSFTERECIKTVNSFSDAGSLQTFSFIPETRG